jgi:phosphoserine phosphatase RsbU/P
MITAEQTHLRSELEQRRERLNLALASPGRDASLSQLLREVDAALARIEDGSYGRCQTCHDSIEPDRLLADPLLQFCLDHLTSDEQRRLEDDLALAARIQRALLPRPDFAPAGWRVAYHYQPAGLVSGDYCDLLEVEGSLLFLMGDVSGKGVAAAMLMSHLHATFRSLAGSGLPLDRLVEAANRIFCESTFAGQFATLVVGRALLDGSVEFVSAGHLPLLHVSSEGVKSREATGVPLGMFYNARFPVHRLSLGLSESLLLFTDGLTEAVNSMGEEYGIPRVITSATTHRNASPEQLISECLLGLRGFAAGAKPADDLTLLLLRRAA